MAASKGKSSGSSKKEGRQVYATSSNCEKCKDQCVRGKDYLARVAKTGKGNGVVCRDLIGGKA